jgi:hypothetical protein
MSLSDTLKALRCWARGRKGVIMEDLHFAIAAQAQTFHLRQYSIATCQVLICTCTVSLMSTP